MYQVDGDYDTLDKLWSSDDFYSAADDRGALPDSVKVVQKFYAALQQIRYVDKLVGHLEKFGSNSAHYTLPDSIAKGVPVFRLEDVGGGAGGARTSSAGAASSNDQFKNFWRPISSLDINIWHRWLHAHRIHALLHHDNPLPKVKTKFAISPNICP